MASSVASASPTNILTSLPARPPTPPRETSHEADLSLKSVVLGRALAFDPRLSLQTPPNAHTPTSPAVTGSNPSSSRVRKRVEWSAHTDYREPAQYPNGLKAVKSSPSSAPASAASSKPVKSILKPSSSPNPLGSSLAYELDGPSSSLNIIEMLDSTIKQLAGSDRDSKLDAYMMLSRALKASNNLPDRVALQDKMSLFMQFVQRDMTAKSESGNLDTSLINHSLTLLATFLHFPAVASTLTTDFGVFVMDHSIRSFEDETMPKDVVRHLMQVVAFQNFSAKVMTSERVGRLIAALHKVENHMKGKSIVMSRLHIYKRLIKQSRNHIATHLDWLKDMFTDMLSSVKDIRSQAIGLGMEAGFALRSEKQPLRKVTELFQTATDGETYIDFYIKRLQGMIKEKHSCNSVPQIWSVVILFLRCPLDRWQYYGPWLTLVQSAFNMTDSSTKQEANFAWNRYVYLSLSDTKASPKSIGTLCQPLLSQLRRKSTHKQQEEAMKLRRVVVGGICNLYYYAFAPGSDTYDPDTLWDVAVQPVINQLISLDGKPDIPGDGIMQAARLLVGLLDVTTPRIWRQDRIMDLPPVKPDELPAIDSKWIRRNCDKVLELAEPIIKKKFLDLANKDSLVYRLWQALVGSITAASAKDIKVSEDTAKFVGCAFSLLSAAYTTEGSESEPSSNLKLLPSVSNFIQLLIDGLGLLPFTEKKLSMTVPNTFEPISTPSQRLDRTEKPRGLVRMPLHHLFVMLAAIPPDGTDDETLASFLQSVFEPFLKGRSAKGRFDLAKELLQLLPRNTLSPYGPWLLAADCAKTYVDKRSLLATGTVPTPDKMNGPEYREIVSLIERGFTSHPNLPPSQWIPLFNSVATQVTSEFGDAGCSLVVIEPLAKALLDMPAETAANPSPMVLKAVTSLFNTAKMPRDKQALEAARSRLWGAPPTLLKPATFEPLENLHKLGNHFLENSYDKHLDTVKTLNVMTVVEAVDSFLVKNLPQFGIQLLVKLQAGLGIWIQDEKTVLHAESQSSLSNSVAAAWDHVCSNLAAQERLESKDLDQIEPLLTAAFKSTHAAIVNRTATAWNSIVKDDEEAEYSDSLMSVISSVRSKVDLVLPGAGRTASDGLGAQTASQVEDHDDLSFAALSSTTSHPNASAPAASSRRSISKGPMTRKRRQEMTPELTREKPAKRTRTPRLRHDNSQIQFKPIASSSPLQDDSQHLTERQKEVRERQRQNAALYSDVPRSPPPPTPTHSLPTQSKEREAPESGKQVEESTPKHAKSFEDLISSTPTPRRGAVFQMDDFNDPPSSPPVPRPYPLLSEIQSRSRAGSAMESWEFSSPPGTPTGNHQGEEAELPPPTLASAESPIKSRRSSKRQRRAAAKARQSTDAALSAKLGVDVTLSPVNIKDQPMKPTLEAVATAVEGVVTRARRVQETPKSEDDLSKKSRSVSRRRSSRRVGAENTIPPSMADNDPNPVVVSDVLEKTDHDDDESKPARDLQSVASTEHHSKAAHEPHECIMVHTDSTCPSPEKLEQTAVVTLTPVVPSTAEPPEPAEPVKPAENVVASGSRRKRKRGGRHSENGCKRQRSIDNEMEDLPLVETKQVSPAAADPIDEDVPTEGIKTRSVLRKRQQQEIRDEPKQTREHAKRSGKDAPRILDGGDTDEEVLSQLVTESKAASQQSQPPQKHEAEATEENHELGTGEDVMGLQTSSTFNEPLDHSDDTKPRTEPLAGGNKTLTIMETLREGLEQLRSVSLTREKVYEVEDILMDMKRELFEAERRGRGRGRPRKRKSRGV